MFTYFDAQRQIAQHIHPRAADAFVAEMSQTPTMPSKGTYSKISDDTLCPITHEPIKAFPREDIFVTLGHKEYHRQTLMRWLQNNDILPHNHTDAKAEIYRIWPERRDRDIKDLANWTSRTQNLSRIFLVSNISVVVGCLVLNLSDENFYKVFHYQRNDDNQKFLEAATYSLFAVMVGLGFAMILLDRSNPLEGAKRRPMTRVENEKAEMGIEYYQSKSPLKVKSLPRT